MRQSHERVEQRLSRLEDRDAVSQAAARAPSRSETARAPEGAVPELTVVKVKPRADEAPALDTSTEIQEPVLDEVANLGRKRGSADEDAADAEVKDPALVEAEFEDAMSGLKTGSFAAAVQKLQAFAAAYPKHPRSDNALYFSGVGFLALDDAESAAHAFDQVIADYPAGDARLDAMLKLAECRVRLDQRDRALELYTRILSHYPGTTAAAQARQRLAHLTR